MPLKLKLASGLLLLLATMTSCAVLSKPPVFATDTYCRVYEPVCISRRDTALTISQVIDNEVVFKRLCPAEAAAGDRKCANLKKVATEEKKDLP